MKLIAISENPYTLTAKFSVAGEEYFLDWFKTRDEMQILDNDAEYLDFTREQCEDILTELKKQNKCRKEIPVNHWKLRNAQDDDEYYRRGRG